jgi:hypothetical protein
MWDKTVKVRMQATKDGARHGFLRIESEIAKGEGIKGPYRGVFIPMSYPLWLILQH